MPQGEKKKDDDELRLLNDLFINRKYNKLARPVSKKDEAIRIDFEIAYVQLVQIVSHRN